MGNLRRIADALEAQEKGILRLHDLYERNHLISEENVRISRRHLEIAEESRLLNMIYHKARMREFDKPTAPSGD